MHKEKRFWLGLCLLNLSLVALFGLLMRSKIVFSIPFLDYRNLLSAHSHFAFGGWVGLALITFLVFDVLPPALAVRKNYRFVLWGIEISSVGMALSFPFGGYNFLSIFFSTAYIFVSYFFGWCFFRDVRKSREVHPVVRTLSLAAVASLVLSSVGPFALSYILITKSGSSLLYRDAIYTFLHFQYNGFFTLGIFALFFVRLLRHGFGFDRSAKRFSYLLVASVVPSLFLALLWHNLVLFYLLAGLGCALILGAAVFFLPTLKRSLNAVTFSSQTAKILWIAAFISFLLKMILTVGTIYPPLGNAVYGARPVIIGFLHLVFLAFVTFFILSLVVEDGGFRRKGKNVLAPLYVFGLGVLANEAFLMIQGLEILFQNNNAVYNWLLWVAAILLFAGAVATAAAFYAARWAKKEATASAAASSNW